MTTDEDFARRLIAELKERAVAHAGNREAFSPDELASRLGISEAEITAAIIHAEGRGWVKPLRSFASSPGGAAIMRVRIEPAGLAEAGSNPRAPISGTTIHGDVVGGDKIETHGERSPIEKKDKRHTGDNNFSLKVWLKDLFGKLGGAS